jgi:hypothetical protein
VVVVTLTVVVGATSSSPPLHAAMVAVSAAAEAHPTLRRIDRVPARPDRRREMGSDDTGLTIEDGV